MTALTVVLFCAGLPGLARAWTFTDVTTQAGLVYQHGYTGGPATTFPQLHAGGVAAGDYDRDGWTDLYVVRGTVGPNLLFHNQHDGTFQEVGAAAGVAITGAVGSGPTFADFDGDGWLDLLVLGADPTRPTLFRNNGNGTFTNVTAGSGLTSTGNTVSAAFGDYDRDGDLDLFLTHWSEQTLLSVPHEHLWRNNGNGTFTDVGQSLGIIIEDADGNPEPNHDFTFTPNFADLDSDGWPDLAVAADFHTSQVFHNNGGSFTDVTDRTVVNEDDGMGGTIGDFDEDGDLDWFVSSIFTPSGNTGNRLYRNHGDGTFDDVTTAAGVREGSWGWGATFADLDNDGHLDVFHVNGYGNANFPGFAQWENDPARLFVSNGNGTFTERAAELGVADTSRGLGVVAFDYDRDGDLDLFVANNESAPKLFRNDGGNAFTHLTVALHGNAPNTEAIGARVYVTAAGVTQMRELRAGSNFVSQDPAEAHFGLGTSLTASTVVVRWPRGGVTTLTNVAANQRLEVTQPAGNPCGDGVVQTGPTYSEDCDEGAANGTAGSCCQVNCTFRPATRVCRASAGACDLAEYCTGTSAACPADAKSTAVCRSAAGICDLPETCDGVGNTCPADAKSTAVCRSAAGICDVAESCDGVGDACPADAFASSSTVCRSAAGICDVAETCTGTGAACPSDAFKASSVVCRSSAGVCDPAETCTGSSAACPSDARSTAVCRSAAGGCDAVETCDGVGVNCPTDVLLPSGTVCADASGCNVAGTCTGASPTCPGTSFAPPGTACTDEGNPCTTDLCNGSGTCVHAAGNAGTLCRSAAGICDVAEFCTGSSTACPTDGFAATSVVCRSASGACDVAEHCTGTGPSCPADGFAASTVVCRSAAGVCDVPEQCTGTGPTCPADAFVASSVVCRSAAGICDVAEYCLGSSAACPPDTVASASTVCRSANGDCDLPETCNGTDTGCPTDAIRSDGSPCNDGVFCNVDTCQGGICVGSTPVVGCLDDFQCYTARNSIGATPFTPVLGLDLADGFEHRLFDVKKVRHVCSPASPSGVTQDAATNLESYQLKLPAGSTPHVSQKNVAVTNRFGTLHFDTKKADMLLEPTALGTSTPPDPDGYDVDHFKCYKVGISRGTPRFTRTTATSGDGFTSPPKTYDVIAPKHLCLPVDQAGAGVKDASRRLVCYKARLGVGQPVFTQVSGVQTTNELATGRVDAKKNDELCVPSTLATSTATQSVARQWDEEILDAIRHDTPRPTVHARNLYHLAAVMWDAWRAYGGGGSAVLTDESHASTNPDADRDVAISFAAYRLLSNRYALSPNAALSQSEFNARMAALGLDITYTSTHGDNPAAVGNRIAANMIAFGMADGSNQAGNYADPTYTPVNAPMIVKVPGTTMVDPNRWQPLALDLIIAQNGIPLPDKIQSAIGMRWNQVTAFALTRAHPTDLYIDPGLPPRLGTATDAAFKAQAVNLIQLSSQMTPDDGAAIDISPGAYGNNSLGTNDGSGRPLNPVTGQPYPSQIVKRGDFGRVLAEFWADGPNSETPPGHWNVLANYVSDHHTDKRIGGTGPVVGNLEWDVKLYLALNGAVHDAAIVAWGVKRNYDSVRPISMIRYMGGLGQSSDAGGPAYHPSGLPLVPGLVEVITAATTAPGQRHEALAGHEGEIAILAWPGQPASPATEHSGVRWIRAVEWVPYQKNTFVTPAFAGFTSGHSTFSRAGAEVLTHFTGSPWFPGGLGEFVAPANAYLTFEKGPTTEVRLQWASFYDAADQAGQSRLWGGIHITADDFNGRITGSQIGIGAYDKAEQYYSGTVGP